MFGVSCWCQSQVSTLSPGRLRPAPPPVPKLPLSVLLEGFRKKVTREFPYHKSEVYGAGTPLYTYLRDQQVLTSDDTRLIARELVVIARGVDNFWGRDGYDHSPKQVTKDVLSRTHGLIRDLQDGLMPPNILASGYIIGVLRILDTLAELSKFWNWLVKKDKEWCDVQTFGLMIEALTYRGVALSVMEGMYKEAQRRFYSGDRMCRSRILLQGIVTARLLNGDWRSAYEGYDLYLMIDPASASRRYIESLFLYERPPKEAAIIFLIACRVGMPPASGLLRPLLLNLWNNYRDVCAMAHILAMYSGGGGKVTSSMMLRIWYAAFVSLSDGPLFELGKRFDEGYEFVFTQLRNLARAMQDKGIVISDEFWCSILNLAGDTQRRDFLKATLDVMTELRISPTRESLNAVVSSCGLVGDLESVVGYWKKHRAFRETNGDDREVFVRALRTCGLSAESAESLASSKLRKTDALSAVDEILASPNSSSISFRSRVSTHCHIIPGHPTLTLPQLRDDIAKAFSHLASTLRHKGDFYDFSSDPLFSSIPSKLPAGTPPPAVSPQEREAYHLALAKLRGTAALPHQSDVSYETGYTAQHVHFENWRSINRALSEAEKFEKETSMRRIQVVDKSEKSLLLVVREDHDGWLKLGGLEDKFVLESQAKKRIMKRRQTEPDEGMFDQGVDAKLKRKNLALRGRLGAQLDIEPLVKDYGMASRLFLELNDDDT